MKENSIYFRSNNLLVTGGAGFIGSNFISYILKKYDDLKVFNIDLLTYAGDLNNLKSFKNNKRFKFIEGDINDQKLVNSIFRKYKIDGVINFAAETHVDNSILNPDKFIQTNINGVYSLLKIAYNFWMDSPFKIKAEFSHARFHQISTDEVYGSINEGSFNEKSLYKPNSPYSASKASADMIVRSFNKTFGLNTTTTLCSNNFGLNQNAEKFIPKIINSLINSEEIIVYGDGNNVRDWIFVVEHCRAIDLVFNKGISGQKYNIGGNFEITNLKLIEVIYEIISKSVKVIKKIKFVKDRYGHDRRYSLNSKKIINELGWRYNTEFNESLKNYVNYKIKKINEKI